MHFCPYRCMLLEFEFDFWNVNYQFIISIYSYKTKSTLDQRFKNKFEMKCILDGNYDAIQNFSNNIISKWFCRRPHKYWCLECIYDNNGIILAKYVIFKDNWCNIIQIHMHFSRSFNYKTFYHLSTSIYI